MSLLRSVPLRVRSIRSSCTSGCVLRIAHASHALIKLTFSGQVWAVSIEQLANANGNRVECRISKAVREAVIPRCRDGFGQRLPQTLSGPSRSLSRRERLPLRRVQLVMVFDMHFETYKVACPGQEVYGNVNLSMELGPVTFSGAHVKVSERAGVG